MPRISALDRKIAAAIAARPFDPSVRGTDADFAKLPEAVQRGVAEAIALAKASGASGDDLRERFGGARDGGKSGGLTGPMRRKVLRDFGFANAKTIARSYVAYSDGDARQGSAASREHGPKAAERQEAARQAVQEAAKAAQPKAAPKRRSTGAKAAPKRRGRAASKA